MVPNWYLYSKSNGIRAVVPDCMVMLIGLLMSYPIECSVALLGEQALGLSLLYLSGGSINILEVSSVPL